MVALLASRVPQRTIHVVGDSEYAGKSISRYLPDNVHLTSRMVMNAALYDRPANSVETRRPGILKGQAPLSNPILSSKHAPSCFHGRRAFCVFVRQV